MTSRRQTHRLTPKQSQSKDISNWARKAHPVSASSLRHTIIIFERGAPAEDEFGGFEYEKKTVSEVWASVKQLQARQIFDYKGKDVEATHIIKIRGDVEIEGLEEMFITHNGTDFEIVQVEADETRFLYKNIMVKEIR